MPVDRLVLIILAVLAAAGVTIWLAAILMASFAMPAGLAALLPLLPVAYVVWRVIADRLGSREDDHYDKMD